MLLIRAILALATLTASLALASTRSERRGSVGDNPSTGSGNKASVHSDSFRAFDVTTPLATRIYEAVEIAKEAFVPLAPIDTKQLTCTVSGSHLKCTFRLAPTLRDIKLAVNALELHDMLVISAMYRNKGMVDSYQNKAWQTAQQQATTTQGAGLKAVIKVELPKEPGKYYETVSFVYKKKQSRMNV